MKQNLVERLKKQLVDKGFSQKRAEVIAKRHLTKSGSIDEAGELTEQGVQRSKMTPEERAFSRSAVPKEAGWYDPVENRVRPL
jgi:hypothetical protein